MSQYNKEYLGGGLMLLLGLGAIVQGSTYRTGTLNQMGPGFFPVAVGGILALVGVAIIINERIAGRRQSKEPLFPGWRAWFYIGLSIAAFDVLGRYGGLVPASFAIVFISALADRQNNVAKALVLALTMTGVSIVIFWWALQIQFPLFSWG
jgi:putative tricarboxylic transport membrane protein